MICNKCGLKLKEKVKFCPNCGREILEKSKTKLNSETVNLICGKCHKKVDKDSQFCTYCGSSINKETADDGTPTGIGKWSWGAAILCFLYAINMGFGAWVAILILLLTGVENYLTSQVAQPENSIGLVIMIISTIYFGFNGRKIAWKKRKWESLSQFQKTQRVWDIWGIIFFVALLANVFSN